MSVYTTGILNSVDNMLDEMHVFIEKALKLDPKLEYQDLVIIFLLLKISELKAQLKTK